jgi:hypothetical protein
MSSVNGESEQPHAPLELSDALNIETNGGVVLRFEVVGIVEDPDEGSSYAVLWHEGEDKEDGQFIVTDLAGSLLENEPIAQQVLDDFLAFAEEDEK